MVRGGESLVLKPLPITVAGPQQQSRQQQESCGCAFFSLAVCLSSPPPSRVTRTPPARVLQALFDHIPVGVGSQGIIPTTAKDLEAALEMGMDWSLRWGTCLSVAIRGLLSVGLSDVWAP